MARPRGGWKAHLTLFAGSILLALFLGEIALQALGVGYGNRPFVGHPVFHHWQPSNYRMRVWSPTGDFGGFDVYFNREGMSGHAELPPVGTPSLVFLGDSFTAALEVPEDNRYVHRVSTQLGVAPVNLGSIGFAPLLSRLALESFADRLSPKAVVLQTFSNDIEDDMEYRKHAIYDRAGRVAAVPGEPTSLSVRLARQSYVARLLRRAWLTVKLTREMNRRSGRSWEAHPWPSYFNKPIEESYSRSDIEGFERSVVELRDLCRIHGWPLLLWVVPDRGAVLRGERDWFYDYMRTFAHRSAVPFIEVAPVFSRERVRELFLPTDIHFAEPGHAAVSEPLVRALTEYAQR